VTIATPRSSGRKQLKQTFEMRDFFALRTNIPGILMAGVKNLGDQSVGIQAGLYSFVVRSSALLLRLITINTHFRGGPAGLFWAAAPAGRPPPAAPMGPQAAPLPFL